MLKTHVVKTLLSTSLLFPFIPLKFKYFDHFWPQIDLRLSIYDAMMIYKRASFKRVKKVIIEILCAKYE